MQCNGNFKQWFNIFLIISEAWQGYELKAYGVSNHNLKLQSKKLSRTRDIPNFPTQGWADTTFCMRNWSETYLCHSYLAQCTIYHFSSVEAYLLWKCCSNAMGSFTTINMTLECWNMAINALNVQTYKLAVLVIFDISPLVW